MSAQAAAPAPAGPGPQGTQAKGRQQQPLEQLEIQKPPPIADAPAIAATRPPFPIPEQDLLDLAKTVLAGGVEKSELLDDSFQFIAPFIGPLDKRGLQHSLATLSLGTAFPDLAPQYYNFSTDPFEPGRVWAFLRPVGTHLGPFTGKYPVAVPPTGRCVQEPPQVASLTFNAQGKVVKYTMGFVIDRSVGNTGGLGGAFGLMWAIGAPLPVPEGRPWSPSIQLRLFNTGNWLLQGLVFLWDRATAFVMPPWAITKHARSAP